MNLAYITERNARLRPDHLAYICEGSRVTHLAFAQRVRKLANALSHLEHQQRVAILSRNCIEFVEVQAATESAGFISVGLNTRLAAPELAGIVADCTPSVLFFEDIYAAMAATLRASAPCITRVIAIGEAPDWAERYEDLMAGGAASVPARASEPTDIAHLIYTSGTTGLPKGAMLDHISLIAAARMTAQEGGAEPTDRMLIVMPLFHIGAKIEQLAFATVGATIFLHRAFDAARILHMIAAEQITAMHLAPVLIQRLVDEPLSSSLDYASLRRVHYSASPMPLPLIRRATEIFGRVFVQIFGMTECTVGTVLQPHQHIFEASAVDGGRITSAGQEFFGTIVRVVDDEDRDCAIEAVGEVLISSPGTMKGYWRAPDATARAFLGGWLRTGDMGYLDREGFLFLVDRKKDVIISGGENIYSREVEDALRQHPDIENAAVIGVPDREWGETVKAFIVPKHGAQISAEGVTEHCRRLIGGYKRPRSIEVVVQLPLLGTGKVDKRALRAAFWPAQGRVVN